MKREATKETTGRRTRDPGAAPLFLLLIGLFLVLVALVDRDSVMGENATIAVGPTTATSAGDAVGEEEEDILTHPIPDPSRLEIPAIGVSAKIVAVGLRHNGEMEIPRGGRVGWYELGPAPGNQGPAVMVGHFDAARDPAVFYHLKDLRPGDEILVYGSDGDVATFEVDMIEQVLKAELPTERIWDYTPEAVIRLVTCGGEWDRRTHHYLSNVIAYGHLVR
jgi:sortase (surface protein transpeptidase)